MLDSQTRAKIILSADDFGISELSNRNILALLRLKKLDRIAVMIDGLRLPNAQEVRELLASGVKIDIHLNAIQKITQGRSFSEPILPRLFDFGIRFVSGRTRSSVMEKRWREELRMFRNIFGRNPDGVSAHQHIHFFPAYFKVALHLAKNFQISHIRFGEKGLVKNDNNVYRIINFLHRHDKKYFREAMIDSSDFWLSLDWVKDIDSLADILPEGMTEVVCHPERREEFEIVSNYF